MKVAADDKMERQQLTRLSFSRKTLPHSAGTIRYYISATKSIWCGLRAAGFPIDELDFSCLQEAWTHRFHHTALEMMI